MKNKILTVVFVMLLAASAVMIWLPADKESVRQENRAIAQMPPTDVNSVLSGNFSSGFESYIGDNVGFRGMFTGFSSMLAANKGITTDLGKIVSVQKDVGTDLTKKARLLVRNNTIMEVFENNREHMDWYLNVLGFYNDNLDKDIRFFSMLIPTQLEFQEPMYSNIQDSQKETIDYVYSNMPDRIIPVNVYDTLREHSGEYIYYRTDHHWTARGAYYAYRALLETMKEDDPNEVMYKPVELGDVPMHKAANFLGYLYKQAQSPEIGDHPDTIEWYDLNEHGNIEISNEEYVDGKSVKYDAVLFDKKKHDYSLFLGGDQPLIELTNTEKEDHRTIIVIRDSYCNCFAPWLIQNYHKVVLVDPRTYSGGLQELIDRYEPDDVMLMNYIFTTTFSDYCQMTIDFFNR